MLGRSSHNCRELTEQSWIWDRKQKPPQMVECPGLRGAARMGTILKDFLYCNPGKCPHTSPSFALSLSWYSAHGQVHTHTHISHIHTNIPHIHTLYHIYYIYRTHVSHAQKHTAYIHTIHTQYIYHTHTIYYTHTHHKQLFRILLTPHLSFC